MVLAFANNRDRCSYSVVGKQEENFTVSANGAASAPYWGVLMFRNSQLIAGYRVSPLI
jgi:hypothetical protein